MNLEKMNLNELIDLENKIKIQKNKRVSVWDSFSLIKKKETELKRIENEFRKEIDNLKSNEQKELEKLGFTIVIYDDIKYIGIINYSIKYEEENKYYCINFDKETNSLSKKIEEVLDEDMQKISKILNANSKEFILEEALAKLGTQHQSHLGTQNSQDEVSIDSKKVRRDR